ncbi:prostaglandin E2 receptor EP4 subtype-like [Ptychodera flava]|uniref:prostaglandin E2 receptor EP4 subtype-like n=1 Tax=Ptychodera flava TaxID=63121 RepID=UPI003969C215
MPYRDGSQYETVTSPASPERDVSGAISTVLEVITLVANILPLLVAVKVKRRADRTVTDYLIAALSTNDMLAVVTTLPVSLPSYFNRRWLGGKMTCEFYQFCLFWFQISAMLLVTAMSFDRLLAVWRPLYYRHCRRTFRALLTIAIIYGITMVASALPLIGLAPPVMVSSSGRLCQSWLLIRSENWHQTVLPFTLLAIIWILMFAVLLCNWFLLKHLLQYKKRLKQPNLQTYLDKKSFKDFTRLVIVVAILFYLTWLPVLVVGTLTQCGLRVDELIALYAFSSTTLNALLNPFVYCALSRQYRRGYMEIFHGILSSLRIQHLCGACHRREYQRSSDLNDEEGYQAASHVPSAEFVEQKVTVL